MVDGVFYGFENNDFELNYKVIIGNYDQNSFT